MMVTEVPTGLFSDDVFVVAPMVTPDGELLARAARMPAGPWLAVLLDGWTR